MESCNYVQIGTCDSCGKKLEDDFKREDPIININMGLYRKKCDHCNSTYKIQTTISFCSWQCFQNCINNGDIIKIWKRCCRDK